MTHAESMLAQNLRQPVAAEAPPTEESAVAAARVQESSPQDLGTLRWLLDIALQPLDTFNGCTLIDQVGPAALRYQLTHMQYALALAQYTRTPAFTGYLAEAQRNLIEKMCNRRVWNYWFWQNLIGNARWSSDPIAYHNVMYTGFYGNSLGLYETLNDDTRFSEPGALQLARKLGGTPYAYDYPRIVAAIRRNMDLSHWTLYPCEPHLSYPMCNTFALSAVRMFDRVHGSDYSDDLVARTRESFDTHGFRRSDGRFLLGKGPLGLKFPVSVGNDMVVSYWLHALMPDLARQCWERVRSNKLQRVDGKVISPRRGGDGLDVGNYRRSTLSSRAVLLACAREMGDEEIAQSLALEFEEHPQQAWAQPDAADPVQRGARQLLGSSGWCNANYAVARFSQRGAAHDLVNGIGTGASRRGPLLSGAAYPDVLVARAANDEHGIDLVLQPGNGACRTTLAFSRLQPGLRYRVETSGREIATPLLVADFDGNAHLGIDLSARTELRLHPDVML